MLRSIKELLGFSILALDGKTGQLDDFYFDDQCWTIRYAVVDAQNWRTGKKVLVSPLAFAGEPDFQRKVFPVQLTKEQLHECPDVDTDRPVSRQEELKLIRNYNWPMSWPPMPGAENVLAEAAITTEEPFADEQPDTHLRSVKKVRGYAIEGTDGTIGHLEDFVVDAKSWLLRYFTVDTNNWLPGGEVLIAIPWIGRISWEDSKVYLELTKEEIKHSPKYDRLVPMNRAYEEKFYDYYQKQRYWDETKPQ